MTRKLLQILLLVFCIFLSSIPCGAKDFRIDVKEKVDFVNIDYFDKFNDAELKTYILTAIENNNQARIASQKSEELKQQMRVVFGGQLPTVQVSPSYLATKLINNMAFNIPTNSFFLPFFGYWEADLLLKNRDKTRSSKKNWEATKFQEQAIYINLAADVATLYTNILKFNKMIELQRELLSANSGYFARMQKQFDQGIINRVQLNDAAQDLKQTEIDLENLIKNREILLTQFAVLLGSSPANINDLKFGDFDNFGNDVVAPKEISSDIIFSRPDVLAAESTLEKAKIDITVARKELLPKFDIIGAITFSTLGGGNFFNWSDIVAFLIAGASQEIFAGGKRIANLKIQKARYEQMFEQYRETDLNALKEVNDALCQLKYDDKITQRSLIQLRYEQNNQKRSKESFENGTISYPALLQENMQLLNAKQSYTTLKTNQIVDNFTLYKAVGGRL